MTHSRTAVFLGAAGALAVMTVLSTAIGFALPQILPRKYTHFAAALLFSYFGWRLLSEALQMYKEGTGKSTDTNEEFEEAEQELAAKGFVDAHKADAADIEAVPGSSSSSSSSSSSRSSKTSLQVATQAFIITFFSECGDRSHLAQIAMGSNLDPIGVVIGGCIGHFLCTGVAVVGGRLLASRISERMVLLVGGVLFLLFA